MLDSWRDWLGLALMVTPIAALLAGVTVALWREYGWVGPAMFWGVPVAIFGPVFLGLWLIHG